jgi:protein arginine kinase activator
MKCQSCNENEATVHLTQVVGGNIRKMHYCEACARKEGVALETPTSIADLLMSPAGILPSTRSSGAACPKCGMTRADFKKGGRLGCAKCYETFTDDVMVLVQSMQHATLHRGKRPHARQPQGGAGRGDGDPEGGAQARHFGRELRGGRAPA